MSTISGTPLPANTHALCPTPSYPPFFDEHPFRIYEKILEGKIEWPKPGMLDANAKDLIKKLLSRDMTSRLGSLKVSVVCVWGGEGCHCLCGVLAARSGRCEATQMV